MLEVQEYLHTPGNSLETLTRDFAIKCRVNEELGVVNLGYDQIASDVSNTLVQECRCLILEMGTWKCLGLPFKRFFNIEENRCPDFNWNAFDTWEKIDGSLILFFWCPKLGNWQISTRSVAGGKNTFDESGESFRALVDRTLVEMGTSFLEVTQHFQKDCCVTMELQSPETQVVTAVHNRSLSLLAVRDLFNLKEIHIHDFHRCYPDFPLPLVQHYPGFTLDAVKDSVQGRNPLEHEGYVLMDDQFRRIKVKSAAYILMSSRRDSLGKSPKARVELILTGQDDDVMGILPVFLQDRITDLKTRINDLAHQIDLDYEKFKDISDQKEFALTVIKNSINSSAMFALRKGQSATGIDYLRNSRPASILDWVHVKDEEDAEAI